MNSRLIKQVEFFLEQHNYLQTFKLARNKNFDFRCRGINHSLCLTGYVPFTVKNLVSLINPESTVDDTMARIYPSHLNTMLRILSGVRNVVLNRGDFLQSRYITMSLKQYEILQERIDKPKVYLYSFSRFSPWDNYCYQGCSQKLFDYSRFL